MPEVVRKTVMQVPMEVLERVILDFEKYPEFVSEVVAARPRTGTEEGMQLVDFEIEVMKRFQYTLEFDTRKKGIIRWRLVDSNFFTSNEGAWNLKAAGPMQTEVEYELSVGVKFLVPGWIAKKLTEVNLPKLLESFEARAKQCMPKTKGGK